VLRVSLPAEGIEIVADAGRIEQAVVNLLSNAAKYTEAGGRVDLVVERDGAEAVIRVRDSGIGIGAEMLPRVFDLFAQGDNPRNRTQGGLGIGLTLVKRLVELHGGRVEAASAGPGAGAEFVVHLPALPATTAETASVPAFERVASGRTRVILVEDNPDAAESLLMLLELLGHQVRVFGDGLRALAAAGAAPPDMMIVDIGLPGIDGYEVARRARKHPALERIVLVALTGYGREEDRRDALAAGFDHHLVKPVEPGEIEGLVAALGRSRADATALH
jgi:two-component system CheB/CheR fusion protein